MSGVGTNSTAAQHLHADDDCNAHIDNNCSEQLCAEYEMYTFACLTTDHSIFAVFVMGIKVQGSKQPRGVCVNTQVQN